MALPNPTLTWNMSSLQAIAGGGAPSNQQVLDALSTLLGSSTYWEVKTSGSVYLVIGPKSGSAIPNFKAIVCDNPTVAYGVHASTAAGIWVGIAPDGGTYTNYKDATPFGESDRFSNYWMAYGNGVGDDMWIYESDEQLWVYIRDVTSYWGFGIGAIFEGADADSVETNDRLYGMMVKGSIAISEDFAQSGTDWTGYTNSTNLSHVGFFKRGVNSFLSVERVQTTNIMDISASMVSAGGTLIGVPLHYRTDSDGGYYVGSLRQIKLTSNFSNRTTISDGVPSTQGYIFSGIAAPSTNDSLLYSNQ
jgi:hypothetical protein